MEDWAINTKDKFDPLHLGDTEFAGDIYINSKGDIAPVGSHVDNTNIIKLVGQDILYAIIMNNVTLFEYAQEDLEKASIFMEELFRDDERVSTISVKFTEKTMEVDYTVSKDFIDGNENDGKVRIDL